jgi:transcriptional regulator with XRE-family HTH domain
MVMNNELKLPFHIGNAIRERMIERQLTVPQFARKLGVSEQMAHYILNSKDVKIGRLWQLSEALNFNFFTLISKERAIQHPEQEETTLLKQQIDGLHQQIHDMETRIEALRESLRLIGGKS